MTAITAESEIRRRIREHGPITFAELMDLGLYHPTGGYYTAGERVGAAGDFYTSPSVHPAFGALLAVQLYQMWQLLGHPSPFLVLEPGAGNGLLCRDIVSAAPGLSGDFAASLRYVCLDRRSGRGYELRVPGASRLASASLPFRGIVGCVLSNELLDAFPVHQVTMRAGQLREIYVDLAGDELIAKTGEPSTPLLAHRLADVGVTLEEGQTAEINLALDPWVQEAASSLEKGFVLAIDYGRQAQELYSASERFRGTLTTYYRHMQTDRPLERLGQQDMSAQVDFTALAGAAKQAGLNLLGYDTQAEFLQNLGLAQLMLHPPVGALRLAQASRIGMRELVKPGGLGDFKVIAFGKGVVQQDLWGVGGSEEAMKLTARMPPLLMTPEHIDLPSGRYPATEVELEMAWDEFWPADPPAP